MSDLNSLKRPRSQPLSEQIRSFIALYSIENQIPLHELDDEIEIVYKQFKEAAESSREYAKKMR
ncbi:MAG: hypothetical protein P1Q69_07060 [Candidatus Thorarchaeota archaeon]|nr:hypothetical protein [Candidatus Thorarchaeota archaeon]